MKLLSVFVYLWENSKNEKTADRNKMAYFPTCPVLADGTLLRYGSDVVTRCSIEILTFILRTYGTEMRDILFKGIAIINSSSRIIKCTLRIISVGGWTVRSLSKHVSCMDKCQPGRTRHSYSAPSKSDMVAFSINELRLSHPPTSDLFSTSYVNKLNPSDFFFFQILF